MSSKLKNNLYGIVVLIGILLRFIYITDKSFWCDEFLAISLSRIPSYFDMVRWIIKNDAHPPLFYSIIRFIFHFTQSEFGLRFIPFLFGAGAVVVFYLLLKQRENGNKLSPLVLFALSPAAVLWSQIVKSYSMLTFFSLLSVLFFLLYQNTYKFKYGVGWVIASLITLYLHNYGVIVISGEIITAFIYRKQIQLRKIYISQLITFIFYLPYLAGPLFSQIAFVKTAPHSIVNPVLRVCYAFFYFIFGETLSPLNLIFVIPGLLFFLVFFVRGIFNNKNILNTLSLVVLIIGLLTIFIVKSTIPQNLIHLQPFFFILVASGIDSIERQKVKKYLSVIAVLFLIPPLFYYYRKDSLQYHDVSKLIPYKEISHTIQMEEKKGEVIIITGTREMRFSQFFAPYSPWDWYYKGNLPVIEVSMAEQLKEIYSRYNGFWVILNYNSPEQKYNEEIKNFFIQQKSVKIKEVTKMIKNYSFLDILKGKGRKDFYLLEVYHFVKR